MRGLKLVLVLFFLYFPLLYFCNILNAKIYCGWWITHSKNINLWITTRLDASLSLSKIILFALVVKMLQKWKCKITFVPGYGMHYGHLNLNYNTSKFQYLKYIYLVSTLKEKSLSFSLKSSAVGECEKLGDRRKWGTSSKLESIYYMVQYAVSGVILHWTRQYVIENIVTLLVKVLILFYMESK